MTSMGTYSWQWIKKDALFERVVGSKMLRSGNLPLKIQMIPGA